MSAPAPTWPLVALVAAASFAAGAWLAPSVAKRASADASTSAVSATKEAATDAVCATKDASTEPVAAVPAASQAGAASGGAGTQTIDDEDHEDDGEEDEGPAPLEAIDWDDDCDAVPDDEELKLVIGVRDDLGMSKGKVAAQVGHAVLGTFLQAQRDERWQQWAQAWHFRGGAKITLKLQSLKQLTDVAAAAAAANLPMIVIEDAGRTEVEPGTQTVVGIGPAPKSLIDAITGRGGSQELRLLA